MTDPIKAKIQSLCPDVMGTHVFEVGYSTCKFCGEPRIIVDRRRENIIVDERSGGSSATVTEKRYDQTDFPCKSNPTKRITLAVVLRAIGKEHPHVTVEANGTIGHYSGIRWNLKKDSYDDQTEETKKFIGKLLEV